MLIDSPFSIADAACHADAAIFRFSLIF